MLSTLSPLSSPDLLRALAKLAIHIHGGKKPYTGILATAGLLPFSHCWAGRHGAASTASVDVFKDQ